MAERFWEKVEKTSGCWLWTAGKRYGYGVINEGGRGRTLLAHRLSWEFAHGPIPKSLHVCHACDNPPCVNPGHLFLGTAKANLKDARAKGRMRVSTKLTEAQVMDIRQRVSAGEVQSAIAREYGLSHGHVGNIVRGLIWTNLPLGRTYGIERGERAHAARLTEAQVRAIKARPDERPVDLAREYGVSAPAIHDIRAGRSWRHVD